MPTLTSLDDLTAAVRSAGPDEELFLRWSKGPGTDLTAGDERDGDRPEQSSRDGLTGVELPGLSANPLRVEPWWGGRSLRLWVARRLYDYRHLREQRGPGVRPWVLVGEQIGTGPDNEPLVLCRRPVAWVADEALRECEKVIDEQQSDDWGPLDRRGT